eukprot:s4666_g4.t2
MCKKAYLPDLAATFDRFNISAEFYATQWFLTLFAYSLPFPQLLRVWDQFLCRGMKTCCRASASLLHRGSQLLSGKNKWLGGVLGRDGNIYCIPCNKDAVLQISTTDSHISTFGSFAERGSFKWSRGLMAGNGNIFGIPARAKSVLKISPTTKEVSTFGTLPEGKWKWHGAVVAPDGAIYCIPAEAEAVLRIDPESDRAETIGDKMPGRWKWYGGLLGSDGCIYGMPYYANSVLKIDPQTGKVTTIGNLPEGSWKWHGGVVGWAQHVLRIKDDKVSLVRGDPIAGWNKFQGGVLAQDGCMFIHRVGLALLTEARPALLGQSFDCTIQRLRCLCQSSQLSPEALVKAALNFKVTNRLLSDLEQAITTPATSSGRGTLPCCFLERDLDRGTTHCRFLPSREGSVRDGSPKSRPAKVVDLAFLEATLPAPRVPADPLVPGPRSPEPAPKGPNAASGATSQLKSFARKSQKVFSKVRPPSVTLGLHRGPGKDAGNTSKAPAGQIRSVGATPAAPPPGKLSIIIIIIMSWMSKGLFRSPLAFAAY